MCGLYGFINYSGEDYKNLSAIVELLGRSSAVRGTDATGIAYNLDGKLHIDKEAKSAYQFKFQVPESAKVVLGHTRKTTQGNQKNNYNNHPFPGKVGETQFALAHNGVIHNDLRLRNQLGLEKPKIETDSYIAVQLIEKFGKWNTDAMKYVGELVTGMFSFTLMDDKDNWYLIKNDSPLVLLHFPELKLYLYASTQTILFEAILYSSKLSDELINPFRTGVVTAQLLEPKAGEIWKIDGNTGVIEKSEYKPAVESYSYGKGGYRYNSYCYDDYDDYYGYGYGEKWNSKTGWSGKGTATVTTKSSTSTTTTKSSKDKYDPAKEATNKMTDKEYYDLLLQIAEGMGHSREDIRLLKAYGYALDEIEEALFDRTLDVLLEECREVVGDAAKTLTGADEEVEEIIKNEGASEDEAYVNKILTEEKAKSATVGTETDLPFVD